MAPACACRVWCVVRSAVCTRSCRGGAGAHKVDPDGDAAQQALISDGRETAYRTCRAHLGPSMYVGRAGGWMVVPGLEIQYRSYNKG